MELYLLGFRVQALVYIEIYSCLLIVHVGQVESRYPQVIYSLYMQVSLQLLDSDDIKLLYFYVLQQRDQSPVLLLSDIILQYLQFLYIYYSISIKSCQLVMIQSYLLSTRVATIIKSLSCLLFEILLASNSILFFLLRVNYIYLFS